MAFGVSQLENRDWAFQNNVTINGTLRRSPTRLHLEEFFKQRPALNAVIGLPGSDSTSPTAAALAAYTVANKDFEVLGTNATTATVTFSATEAGIVLTTTTGSNDQVIICPHLDTNQTAWAVTKWGTENAVEYEAAIRLGASIANIEMWVGLKLTNTPTIATDDDQAYFHFSSATDTNWHAVVSRAGTDVDTTTSVAVAVSTIYRFRVSFDANRVPSLYINDVLVYTGAAMTNDIDLIPYVGVQTLTTAAKAMTLHYEKIGRTLFEF